MSDIDVQVRALEQELDGLEASLRIADEYEEPEILDAIADVRNDLAALKQAV